MKQQTASGAWKATDLRLTSFPASVAQGKPTWWEDVAGAPAEVEVTKRGQGFFQQEGAFQMGRLTLTVQVGRVDWLFRASPEKSEDSGEVPSIGPLEEALGVFGPAMDKWLGSGPPGVRLAFGAVVIESAESLQGVYSRLQDFLPTVQLDPIGSSDFMYRINRPRPSKSLPGLKMNRLSTWSALQAIATSFQIPIGRPTRLSGPAVAPVSSPASRLELDISTAEDYLGQLPADKLIPLFDEMVELAREVAANGDVK